MLLEDNGNTMVSLHILFSALVGRTNNVASHQKYKRSLFASIFINYGFFDHTSWRFKLCSYPQTMCKQPSVSQPCLWWWLAYITIYIYNSFFVYNTKATTVASSTPLKTMALTTNLVAPLVSSPLLPSPLLLLLLLLVGGLSVLLLVICNSAAVGGHRSGSKGFITCGSRGITDRRGGITATHGGCGS